MLLIALQLIAHAKLYIEGGVVQNRCSAAFKGEAATVNHCRFLFASLLRKVLAVQSFLSLLWIQ